MGFKNTILLFLLCMLSFSQIKAQKDSELTRVLFILDASNSMNNSWDRQTRIAAAKELLLRSIDSIKDIPNLELALRVYGHQSIVTPTYQDCNDTKLEVPFGKNNYYAIQAKVNRIQAKGTTPIARSLEAAADDFPSSESKNIIILITDGLEACDGDPCIIAKKLRDKKVNVTPFVIGLGMDLSYLDKFSCIGEYSAAEDRKQFQAALSRILHKTINTSTTEIDLNDIYLKPTETNVTVDMYKAGTNEIMYSFIHTLNSKGNPDTLEIDPNHKYDIRVATIPPVAKKNVELFKNTHNVIPIYAPQGKIKMISSPTTNNSFLQTRITDLNNNTLHVQRLNEEEKYIVGTYQVEVLSFPRMMKTVKVEQSQTTTITIPAPGILNYRANFFAVGQIFVKNERNEWEWVVNIDSNNKNGQLQLLPGDYRIVYRYEKFRETDFSRVKEFKINSNKTILISL